MTAHYLKNGKISIKHPHSKDNRTTNLSIPPRVVNHKNKQDNPHVVTEWQFSDNPTRRMTRPQAISVSRQNWRGSVAQVWSAGLLGVISRWVADKTSSERPQTRHLDSLPPPAMCSHSRGSWLWTQDDWTVKRWAQSARGQGDCTLVGVVGARSTSKSGSFGEMWTQVGHHHHWRSGLRQGYWVLCLWKNHSRGPCRQTRRCESIWLTITSTTLPSIHESALWSSL